MILLREVQERDLEDLYELADIPGFLNLQADRQALIEKIEKSLRSFRGENRKLEDDKYVFVAEDLESKRVLGTSMIAGQHGTKKSPHFYFQVDKEEKYAKSISMGLIHGTLQLKFDIDGPSEIGGLVVNREYRNTEERIGRQISFVRFLYLALHKKRFKPKLIAELLPPLDKRGRSPLWEAIGRRFTNMDYWEADMLCQNDKEFILSLFPTEKIYTTLLPADARNAIGKVGKDTQAVYHMLNRIGFEYHNQVDPFDGGPHLWAEISNLEPVKNTSLYSYGGESTSEGKEGILCREKQREGEFRALHVSAILDGKNLFLSKSQTQAVESVLGLKSGESVYFMPYY